MNTGHTPVPDLVITGQLGYIGSYIAYSSAGRVPNGRLDLIIVENSLALMVSIKF